MLRVCEGDTLTGNRLRVPRWSVVFVVLATSTMSACASDRDERAEKVARTYLRAAAAGDTGRLCALRTEEALGKWGGKEACRRRAVGLAIGPPLAGASRAARRRMEKKAAAVDPHQAKMLPADTSTSDKKARVVIHYGDAVVEDGHAVAGEILEMDLQMQGDEYRVARLGFAAFVD
jgi:hypothetical protein